MGDVLSGRHALRLHPARGAVQQAAGGELPHASARAGLRQSVSGSLCVVCCHTHTRTLYANTNTY